MRENKLLENGLSLFNLKLIGVICIILQNLAWSGVVPYRPLCIIMGIIGSAGMTIFIFAANEALKKTSSLIKYLVRLLVVSVICGFPYSYIFGSPGSFKFSQYLCSTFSIFFIVGSLMLYDKIKQKGIRIFSVVFLLVLSFILGLEWAPFCLVLAYFIHIYEDKPKYRDFNIIMFFVVVSIVCSVFLFMDIGGNKDELLMDISLIGTIFSLPLINLYNGERGMEKSAFVRKWMFYIIYLIVIVALAGFKFLLRFNIGA